MNARATILLVEDEETLRVTLQDNLEEQGYDVRVAATGEEAKKRLVEAPADLVVLDLMLPDVDGYTLCRRIKTNAPATRILMLTARTLEEDLVRGFEAGADDYVAKPYRLRELFARISALLRRGAASAPRVTEFAGFKLDRDARTVTAPRGHAIDLTRTEFDLLAFLLENRSRVLSRQCILDEVWGEDVIVDTRTVDNFVSALKKKLRWRPDSGFDIRSIRGIGYRLDLPP